MRTPWRLLYDAGQSLDQSLANQPAGVASRIVSAFYFIAVFVAVALIAGAAELLAPNSSFSQWLEAHFDTVFFCAGGAFIFYMLGMTFWQAFFPPKEQKNG